MDPVTEQPKAGSDGKVTETVDGKLPNGLRQLGETSEVTVQQHIDSVEVVVCCCMRPNRYSVYAGKAEEQCLYIQEGSDCYARQIMGAARSFNLKFTDNDLVETVRLIRPQTCSRGCLGVCCTLPTMKIQTPPGKTMANITERRSCLSPVYDVTNLEDQLMFTMRPACCYSWITGLLCDIHIPIYNADGSMVAELVKKTRGKVSECLGQTNNFSVTYLAPMSAVDKVILLGAVFLLDFHYFERQNRFCC